MTLIVQSSAGMGTKNSKVDSNLLPSFGRMVRLSCTLLYFPNTDHEISGKILNQINLSNGSFGKCLAILVKCTHLPSVQSS